MNAKFSFIYVYSGATPNSACRYEILTPAASEIYGFLLTSSPQMDPFQTDLDEDLGPS